MTAKEYYEANKERILINNRQYRKDTKYHLRRDKAKQSKHVNNSQKKNRERVTKYHRKWRASKRINKELNIKHVEVFPECLVN